jgi:hypothetical protein
VADQPAIELTPQEVAKQVEAAAMNARVSLADLATDQSDTLNASGHVECLAGSGI